MKLNKKIFTIAITTLLAISPALSFIQTPKAITTAQAATKSKKNTFKLRMNAEVYNKKGKVKKTYRGSAKKASIPAGTTLKYSGKPIIIKGKPYFYLGAGGYIRAVTVNNINNKNTLCLDYNSYVYDKKGKRRKTYRGSRKNTFIYNGMPINYVGKTQLTSTYSKKYYFHDPVWNQYWLPYRTIKGKQYYNIGAGGYIKAANVSFIDDHMLFANQATVTVKPYGPGNKIPIYNTSGKTIDKTLTTGQKVIVDRQAGKYDINYNIGDNGDTNFYRLKNTNKFIATSDVKAIARQQLRFYSKDSGVAVINKTNTYTINGNKEVNNVVKSNEDGYSPVDELLYIWVPEENKAELFYHLKYPPKLEDQQTPHYNDDFIKASDVNYVCGPKLKPVNTAEEAQNDIATASPTDKQKLQTLINQERANKINSAYNNALTKAETISNSKNISIAEIKQTIWSLNKIKKALCQILLIESK